MSSTPIKSGTDIVNEFLKSLTGESEINVETLEAVRLLVSSDSLTVTRLLQRLDSLRKVDQKQNELTAPENNHDG